MFRSLTRQAGLRLAAGAIALAGAWQLMPVWAGSTSEPPSLYRAAPSLPNADHMQLLGVSTAGGRLVAVGERGVVLLSDDQGSSWRQSRSVPFDGLLTSVTFVDAQQGWAVGHGGVVLHSADGGETWVRQRLETTTDRPLFAVHFFDASHGVAVGLWSLVLLTDDGGQHWREQAVAPMAGSKRADLNLFGLFGGRNGELYAVAERGKVLRSRDRGASWDYLDTGYGGSFWCGIQLSNGTLLAGGLRGSLYRSDDEGASWSRVQTGGSESLTAIDVRGDSEVEVVGLDGFMVQSADGGRTFKIRRRADRLSFTGVKLLPGGVQVLLSRTGPVAIKPQ